MLARHCFGREWIDRHTKDLRSSNHNILETAIAALQLVGYLAEAGLPFQFRGGTSLMLLVQPVRRLSVDIDIVTQVSHQELEDILRKISGLWPFEGYDRDLRRDTELPPKKHYKLRYPSLFHPPPHYVKLDVLFEAAPARLPPAIPIRVPFIEVERDVHVITPGIDALLGDKLTAFAPTTIGILHDPDFRMDIVKQLFDVGVLFDIATDLPAIAAAYNEIHANQCRYRGNNFTLENTLNDTINAGLSLTQHEMKGEPNPNEHGPHFAEGIGKLQTHLVGQPFKRDQARAAAGKAACLAALLLRRPPGVTLESMRFRRDQLMELKKHEIVDSWRQLSKLRGANPEAFYYWLRAQQILLGS